MQLKKFRFSLLSFFWILLFCGVVLFRFWLVDVQDLTYQGSGYHDDRLFIEHSRSIYNGEWLGPFRQTTLAKGPFYPFFIASLRFLGVPLLLGQNILYVLAISAICWSLHPILKKRWLTFLLFVILMFQPAGFESDVTARVIRAGVSVSLTLLILAGLIRAFVSPLRSLNSIVLGSATGLFIAAFWMNREDNIWLIPAVIILLAGIWIRAFIQRKINRPLFTFSSALLCFLSIPILVVMMLNAHYYQLFVITDFQHSAFPSAYGSLVNVKPEQRYPYVPVTASTRHAIYQVSPLFKQLEPVLEDQLAADWATYSQELTGFPPEKKEIGGGWWMWALRDAVFLTGHYTSGADAAAYYMQLSEEVTRLCEEKKLSCYSTEESLSFLFLRHGLQPRNGLQPYLDNEDFIKIITKTPQVFLLYFADDIFSPFNQPSDGTAAEARIFQTATNEKLFFNQSYFFEDWNLVDWTARRFRILENISTYYQTWTVFVVIIGIGCFLHLAYLRDTMAVPLLAILASGGLLFFIVTTIDLTSFPAYGNIYLAAEYPLFIIFSFVSIYRYTTLTFTRIKHYRSRKAKALS